MNEFDDFQQRLNSLKTVIRSNRARIALIVAHDLNAAVKLDIQETGRDSSGAQFSPYTPQYAIKGRKQKGYQAEYVDFTRTGRMMANIQPQVASDTKEKTLIVITARSQSERAKLRGQARYRGNIIRPSKKRISELVAQFGSLNVVLVKSII